MMPNTFDVISKRRRINVFKVGKLWVFKQFFDNKEIFKALLGYLGQQIKPLMASQRDIKHRFYRLWGGGERASICRRRLSFF